MDGGRGTGPGTVRRREVRSGTCHMVLSWWEQRLWGCRWEGRSGGLRLGSLRRSCQQTFVLRGRPAPAPPSERPSPCPQVALAAVGGPRSAACLPSQTRNHCGATRGHVGSSWEEAGVWARAQGTHGLRLSELV